MNTCRLQKLEQRAEAVTRWVAAQPTPETRDRDAWLDFLIQDKDYVKLIRELSATMRPYRPHNRFPVPVQEKVNEITAEMGRRMAAARKLSPTGRFADLPKELAEVGRWK